MARLGATFLWWFRVYGWMAGSMNSRSPRYGPVSFPVEAEHVARFAGCLGADGSAVPPTFAAVYAFQYTMDQAVADRELGIDALRMLHGEQEFTWADQPRIGETLSVGVDLVSDEMRGTLRVITLVADVAGADGRAVCASRTVLVVR
jgi:hypothetical protein